LIRGNGTSIGMQTRRQTAMKVGVKRREQCI